MSGVALGRSTSPVPSTSAVEEPAAEVPDDVDMDDPEDYREREPYPLRNRTKEVSASPVDMDLNMVSPNHPLPDEQERGSAPLASNDMETPASEGPEGPDRTPSSSPILMLTPRPGTLMPPYRLPHDPTASTEFMPVTFTDPQDPNVVIRICPRGRPKKQAYDPSDTKWPCTLDGCDQIFRTQGDLIRHQKTAIRHETPGLCVFEILVVRMHYLFIVLILCLRSVPDQTLVCKHCKIGFTRVRSALVHSVIHEIHRFLRKMP